MGLYQILEPLNIWATHDVGWFLLTGLSRAVILTQIETHSSSEVQFQQKKIKKKTAEWQGRAKLYDIDLILSKRYTKEIDY